jgi:hypothetical protein
MGMAAILFAGCATEYSEVPRPTNYSVLKQKKMQAASHWELIANDVAEQIKNNVDIKQLLYVAPPRPDTEFTKAFNTELITALVNKGMSVSRNGDTRALNIEVETQLVRFSPYRHQNSRFVSATAITGGIMALNGLDMADKTAIGVGVLGLAAARDWHEWMEREYARGFTPMHELIVTTSATNSTQYVARRTDVYYIEDWDNRLYKQPADKTITVTGGAQK